MISFAIDENFNNDIVRGLLRRSPNIDVKRVQDAGLSGADDPTVLAWAASEDRVLLTHDVATMTQHAYDRIAEGSQMPGVFEIGADLSVGEVIEELVLLAECSHPGEWMNQVRYLPLR